MTQPADAPQIRVADVPSGSGASRYTKLNVATIVEDDVTLLRSTGSRSWVWIRDVLETLVLAVVIFALVNTLTGRYEVQSISMEPTLHEGQYLIVSKFAYWLRAPQRGDIVVLEPPDDRSPIPYIKRVIGLPGERVEIREGRIWINGIALNEPYVSGPPLYEEAFALNEEEYLVLGDNRNNSSDSHVWGTLPQENLMGKTIFRYWPPEKWGGMPHYSFPELEGLP